MKLQEKINLALSATFKKKDGSMNYSAAAKEIGVSRQSIMGWAKGSVNVYEIKLVNLMKIAEATENAVEWFLSDEVKKTKTTNSHQVTEPHTGYTTGEINTIRQSVSSFRRKTTQRQHHLTASQIKHRQIFSTLIRKLQLTYNNDTLTSSAILSLIQNVDTATEPLLNHPSFQRK